MKEGRKTITKLSRGIKSKRNNNNRKWKSKEKNGKGKYQSME